MRCGTTCAQHAYRPARARRGEVRARTSARFPAAARFRAARPAVSRPPSRRARRRRRSPAHAACPRRALGGQNAEPVSLAAAADRGIFRATEPIALAACALDGGNARMTHPTRRFACVSMEGFNRILILGARIRAVCGPRIRARARGPPWATTSDSAAHSQPRTHPRLPRRGLRSHTLLPT